MNVRSIGTMLFHVQSEANPKKFYHVDLLSRDTNGACSCEHFCCRLQPLIEREESVGRCKHILACREFVLDDMLSKLAKAQKE